MDWVGFIVLGTFLVFTQISVANGWILSDIGLPAYESIPKGPRILAGLFQGLAARASGLSIVPIASLAPALQYATLFGIHASLVANDFLLRFLYVVMMYIAVNFIPSMKYSHITHFC